MEVILLKDVEKVGDKLDIISVKPGFGRNYLIPRGLAMVANKSNRSKIDEIKSKEAELESGRIEEAKAIAAKIEATPLKIGAKAGASGKIFGSVTSVQLIAALKDQLGVEVDRRIITLTDEVKDLGSYTATAKLHKQVIATINYEVIAE